MRATIRCSTPCATTKDLPGCLRASVSTQSHKGRGLTMKTITTAVAVLVATIFMTACAKKDSPAPAEAAPVVVAPAVAPAEAAPAEAAPAANDEDGSQTSGDKVAPK